MDLYLPFNSVNGDRNHDATDIAGLFASLYGDGILLSSLGALQVIADSDWGVTITSGRCIIRGRIGINSAPRKLTISPASSGLSRIDRIVLRCDYLNRKIIETVIQGVESANPQAPALRDDSEAVDIKLAQVLIAPADVAITQKMITDERVFSQATVPLDTNALFAKWDARFTTWFDSIEAQLEGNVGANLANRILGCVYVVSRKQLSVPITGWTQNAQNLYEKTVALTGTVADSTTQRVRYAVKGDQVGKALLAGCRVDENDKITLVCLVIPPEAFTLEAIIEDVRD